MEKRDQELLLSLSENDPKVKKLYDQHQKLERAVARLSAYAAFSPAAQLKTQELKKEKLRGMDHLMTVIKHYRDEVAAA